MPPGPVALVPFSGALRAARSSPRASDRGAEAASAIRNSTRILRSGSPWKRRLGGAELRIPRPGSRHPRGWARGTTAREASTSVKGAQSRWIAHPREHGDVSLGLDRCRWRFRCSRVRESSRQAPSRARRRSARVRGSARQSFRARPGPPARHGSVAPNHEQLAESGRSSPTGGAGKPRSRSAVPMLSAAATACEPARAGEGGRPASERPADCPVLSEAHE